MVSGDELILMICKVVATSPATVPISLMNHAPDVAGQIIVEVLEHCARNNCPISFVHLDQELASILKFKEGETISSHSSAILKCEYGLGRQVKFVRAPI